MTREKVLSGRTAFITGGSGGIASAAAELLLRDGAHVVLMSRQLSGLEAVRQRLVGKVPEADITLVAGDATDAPALKDALRTAYARDGRLDMLLATVGGVCSMGPFVGSDLRAFRQEFDRNVLSAALAIQEAAPLMSEGGAMVFVSSTAGGNPFPLLAGYAAAKAALEHFVRTVADELGSRGIRANCVRAGMTRTNDTEAMFQDPAMMAAFDDLVPLGRLGDPRDVGAAIRYLLGPESGWVTGHVLTVDGGQMLRRNPVFAVA